MQETVPVYTDLNPDDPFAQPIIENVPAVLNSLANIFSTNPNERLFNLDITADLESLLFELMTQEIAIMLYAKIITAIERFEPRVRIIHEKSAVIPDYDNNRYVAIFEFAIYGFNGSNQFRFNLNRKGI